MEVSSVKIIKAHLFFSFEYLNNIMANRFVPVEIGLTYSDDDWKQQMMHFSDFLDIATV